MTRSCGVRKVHKYTHLSHIAGETEFVVFNNNLKNCLNAVYERIFYVRSSTGELVSPPQPTRNVFGELSKFSRAFAKHVVRTAPLPWDKFPGLYVGRKHQVYKRALLNLLSKTWSLVKLSKVKTFVKIEKLKQKLLLVPRVIQPRTPEFNLLLGCYIKPIEHRIYSIIDLLFRERVGAIRTTWERSILKGLNAIQQAKHIRVKWDRHSDCVFIGMDAKRFDQHVSKILLAWEHSIYALFYVGSALRKLKQLLSYQLVNRGKAYYPEGTISYTVEGKRMSGDMNTGLGNCLIMCAMLYTYFNSLGIDYDVINNGDDCGVFMSRSSYLEKFNVDHLKDWFLSMGFTMEVEPPVFEFEGIEFCQTQPVRAATGYTMVRNPRTSFTKDCMSVEVLRNMKAWKQHWDSVAMNGMSLNDGIPVMQAYYQCLKRSASVYVKGYNPSKKYVNYDMKNSGLGRLSEGLTFRDTKIDDEARVSFWRAFGITPSHQVVIEEYLNKLTIVGKEIPSFDSILRFRF